MTEDRSTEMVRLDRKVKARLARLAKRNRRSLSAELAIAAERHIKATKAEGVSNG